ncbi:hypothetical protein ACIA8F_03885 [Streptomyces sp. NPDC051563]|uniref:hypothetical protein n=1 Tax=Streptomyces sp. NPDC051563 TaxID=3365659 RepID=UPI0037BA0804
MPGGPGILGSAAEADQSLCGGLGILGFAGGLDMPLRGSLTVRGFSAPPAFEARVRAEPGERAKGG